MKINQACKHAVEKAKEGEPADCTVLSDGNEILKSAADSVGADEETMRPLLVSKENLGAGRIAKLWKSFFRSGKFIPTQEHCAPGDIDARKFLSAEFDRRRIRLLDVWNTQQDLVQDGCSFLLHKYLPTGADAPCVYLNPILGLGWRQHMDPDIIKQPEGASEKPDTDDEETTSDSD